MPTHRSTIPVVRASSPGSLAAAYESQYRSQNLRRVATYELVAAVGHRHRALSILAKIDARNPQRDIDQIEMHGERRARRY